jgi:hypothetical protein
MQVLKKHNINVSRYVMNCLILKAMELEDLKVDTIPEEEEGAWE